MKDVKTKPKGTDVPKNKPKFAEKGISPIKDIKAVMKDRYIRQQAEIKSVSEPQEQQAERPENYATENVENAAYNAVDTVYHKGKSYAENKIKKRVSEKNKIRNETVSQNPNTASAEQSLIPENSTYQPKTNTSAPKTADNPSVNTPKERTVSEQAKAKVKEQSVVKTKESYIKQHSVSDNTHSPKMADKKVYRLNDNKGNNLSPRILDNVQSKNENEIVSSNTPKQQAQKYVKTKQQAKKQAEKSAQQNIVDTNITSTPTAQETKPTASSAPPEKSNVQIKTKESYIKNHGKNATPTTENPYKPKIKADYISNAVKTKVDVQNTETRIVVNKAKQLKTKNNTNCVKNAKNTFKPGNKVKQNAVKIKKAAAKTQKEITKKAAKQAARQAKIAAQKAAQVTKAAAKSTAKVAVKLAQVVAHAVKTLVSALVTMGGWAVLLVVLIVIIIVAAIAASPFGIFLSDEVADSNSIPISSIVAECNVELSNKLTEIEDNAAPDRIVMEGEQANWSEVLAVFSVKVAGTDDETAEDVVVITEDKKQKLKDIFWEMNSISSRTETVTSGETTEKILYITLNHKIKDDMINEYHFTERQQEALTTLLENNDVLVGATQSLAISDATAQEVLHSLPDGLSQDRKNVIKAACSLVGKVNYFWGGKSASIGWDSNWGKMTLVTAEGSRTSGSMRPFGLDCSGFVTWSFINAGKTGNAIGYGTQGQIAKATRISWSAAQPGDLAFLSDISHVGIVAGRDLSGNILVIHCSSGANNVVITTNSIFGFAARPSCY